MRKILVIFLENESGALSRVIGLFSQRGYNIESLNVAPTNDPTLSLVTIQTLGDKKIIEQIEKQLHKLIDVFRVVNIGQEVHIERELLLLKVKTTLKNKENIYNITKIFRGSIIHVNIYFFIIQISGTTKKLNAFIKTIKELSDIIESSRSGIIGISCN